MWKTEKSINVPGELKFHILCFVLVHLNDMPKYSGSGTGKQSTNTTSN